MNSLEDVARRVNWYTEPTQILANTNLFLSQVMARGSAEDIVAVQQRYSKDQFKKAYVNEPPVA